MKAPGLKFVAEAPGRIVAMTSNPWEPKRLYVIYEKRRRLRAPAFFVMIVQMPD